MNNGKQYLFTANGSYFGQVLIAAAFLFPAVYGVLHRGWIDYNEANVLMFPLGVALLLTFAATTEACMMIRSKGHLFAYNVDKAMCISLDRIKWDDAVAIARKLYGPVFDSDCARQFSTTPKSPPLRKLFYSLVSVMFLISVISPCHHLSNAFLSGTFPLKLIAAWVFIVFDAVMVANRIFFRASIRKLWAMTLGDDNFRSILNFELSTGEDSAELPYTVVIDDNALNNDSIPGYTNRIPSRKRLILTGVVLIILVVWVLNSRRNKPTDLNNVSTECRPVK